MVASYQLLLYLEFHMLCCRVRVKLHLHSVSFSVPFLEGSSFILAQWVMFSYHRHFGSILFCLFSHLRYLDSILFLFEFCITSTLSLLRFHSILFDVCTTSKDRFPFFGVQNRRLIRLFNK